MIAKHKINFESELLRNFEKVAIKKGIVVPDKIQKVASIKESFNPSDDLQKDFNRLITGLRAKGYEEEADSIEDGFFIHKQAEVHLYNAFDTDGEDLLEFAHPDGEFSIGDSEYGKIETLLTTHKKILDKIMKMPTGKYASLEKIARSNGLVKTADDYQKAQQWIEKNVKRAANVLFDQIFNIIKQNLTNTSHLKAITWNKNNLYSNKKEINNYFINDIYNLIIRELRDHSNDPEDYMFQLSEYIKKRVSEEVPKIAKKRIGFSLLEILHEIMTGKALVGKVKSYNDNSLDSSKDKKKRDLRHETLAKMWHNWMSNVVRFLSYWLEANKKHKSYNDLKTLRSYYYKSVKRLEKLFSSDYGYIFENMLYVVTPLLSGRVIEDMSELIAAIKYKKEQYEKWKKTASIKNNLIRTGSPTFESVNRGDVGEQPGAGSPAPTNTGGGSRAVGQTKAIQLALLDLAKYGTKHPKAFLPIVTEALYMKPYGARGGFGSLTKEALRYAEIIRKHYKKTNVGVITQTNTPETLKNVKALLTAIKGGKDGEDKKGVIGMYHDVPVGFRDLLSLRSFYEWGISNTLLSQLDHYGKEYIIVQSFTKLIGKLKGHAEGLIKGSKDKKERNKNILFMREINGLLQSWMLLYKKLVIGNNGNHPGVVYLNQLGEAPPLFTGKLDGERRDYRGDRGDSSRSSRRRSSGEGIQVRFISDSGSFNFSAEDVAKGIDPPISSIIDLNDERWEMDEKFVLDYYGWRGANPNALARKRFGKGMPVKEMNERLVQYMKNLGPNYPKRKEAYETFRRNLIGNTPEYRFKRFLGHLSEQISTVFNEWESTVTDREARRSTVPRSGKDAERWQNLISKFFDTMARNESANRSRGRSRYRS